MQIFTDTNHIENIFHNTTIMQSNDLIDLYIIDKEQNDILKIMAKLGPILFRTKYHLSSMNLDLDIAEYINCIKNNENVFFYFDQELLSLLNIHDNHNDINNELEINLENTTTNKKGKYPFKEKAKEDLKNGLSVTAVMNKYNCNRNLIYSWKREIDKETKEINIKESENQQREKIINGLILTSPKFEIDVNKTFSEEDGTIYYIDYQWHIKIKECFEKVGLEISKEKIWIIEKIFEEYLESVIDNKVFEAVLKANDIHYSSGIIQNLYEKYIDILNEYQNKNKFEQLYKELYDE